MATVIFAANTESYRKRKRVHRACEQCKRQRRRCEPALNGSGRCVSCVKHNSECSLSEPSPPSPPHTDSEEAADSTEPRTRFIGDLSPEVVFLASSRSTREIQRDLTECGVWDRKRPVGTSATTAAPGASKPRQYRARISPAYQMYLENIRAFDLPDKPVLDRLVEIYLRDIHPLLPVLDKERFVEEMSRDAVSLPLLLAVCLVAIKHPDAEKWVPAGKTKRSWAARVADQIIALVNGKIEPDRLTLTRIHLLLALHSEGPAGNENASLHLSTALHHAYSLGLQMHHHTVHQATSDVLLWWCLWIMDAIQAVICGRPMGIRKADVSIPFPTALDIDLSPEFRAMLKITDMLIRCIALYRPCAGQAEWSGEWPVLTDVDFGEGPKGDALRLFYYAVGILSVRSYPVAPSSSPSSSSILLHTSPPSPAAQRRRTESALSILSLCRSRHTWLPLPIVPYSVALSLSVFYSTLHTAPDAGNAFLDTCTILESLTQTWWFAGAIAKIGRQALEKVRVAEAADTLREIKAATTEVAGNTQPVQETRLETEDGDERRAEVQDEVREVGGAWDAGFGSDAGTAVELGGDEWFLQLFSEVVVPVDFWRGLDIDVEDGTGELGDLGIEDEWEWL